MARTTHQLALPLDVKATAPPTGGPPGPPPRRRGGSNAPPPPPPPIPDTSLAEEAQRRYLNYALSVITSRALPDVRDGLKPVQRRILYTMRNELRLDEDSKPVKSARVVGDVIGKYHPHGDTAAYDAMVRMAQGFVMRAPLVDGHGNFGSADGDSAAAYRYTEARLQAIAGELLNELGQRTVPWRPNYDNTRSEPVVLPARYPNLLVNGSQGIAVGMATSIPPHNLGEVVDACIALIDDPKLSVFRLLTHVKGPDFPTGGQLHATKHELEALYTAGQGTLKLRGEWRAEEEDKKGAAQVVVTSIPYAVERKTVVEKIADVIIAKKLPALVNVRDESTDEVRIVLELKRGTDPQLVMAYLMKHTPLAVTVPVNLTCLVPVAMGGPRTPQTPRGGTPDDAQDHAAPKRLGIAEMLRHFLDFRFETVTKRIGFELGQLQARIHLLEGLEIVFDAVDEVIRIIRKSDGKADAAAKLITRFKLSEEQADAILELKLYRLAKLEILVVQKELAEKRAEAKKLETLLKSEAKRWTLIKTELGEIKKLYGDKRRTRVVGAVDEPAFEETDFIAEEDANVILSAQGWVKRVREVKDLATTRLREGDAVLAAVAGSTRASVAFFSNLGGCYVCRIHDVPASTGYGDPVQKLFKLADGERMIATLSFDGRALEIPEPSEGADEPEPPFALAVTRQGLGFRFSLRAHGTPSTRAGRKFARLNEGDEVILVEPVATHTRTRRSGASDAVFCAASDGHALAVPVEEIAILSGVGKGAMVMKLDEGERLVGAALALGDKDTFVVETEKGKEKTIAVGKVTGARAGRGHQLVRSDRYVRLVAPPPVAPSLEVT